MVQPSMPFGWRDEPDAAMPVFVVIPAHESKRPPNTPCVIKRAPILGGHNRLKRWHQEGALPGRLLPNSQLFTKKSPKNLVLQTKAVVERLNCLSFNPQPCSRRGFFVLAQINDLHEVIRAITASNATIFLRNDS